jgi:hypothetical protein
MTIICGILFNNVAYMASEINEGCLLLNTSNSIYSCAGVFSLKPYSACSNSYYQIHQDVMWMDTREITKTCGNNVKYPICMCCVNTLALKCQTIPVQLDVDKCTPLLYQNLDYYNNLKIGNTYKCWENENSFPSFIEPDLQYQRGLIAGISIGLALFLIPIIVWSCCKICRQD